MRKALFCFLCFAKLWALKSTDPVVLSNSEHPASHVQVGVNAKGEAVAVWIAEYGQEYAAEAAVKSARIPWTLGTKISAIEADIKAAHCVIDAFGNMSASWLYDSGDAENIFQVAERTSSEKWSSPLDIAKEDKYTVLDQAVFTPQGTLAVIGYKQFGDKPKKIVAGIKTPGGKPEYTHLASAKACCGGFRHWHLAVSAHGSILALWERETKEGHFILEYAWKRGRQSWTTPESIPTLLNLDYDVLEILIDAQESINLVWQAQGKVYAACTCHGVWSQPVEITEADEKGSKIKAAVDEQGNALIVWESKRNDKINYRAVFKPAGDAWSPRMELCQTTDLWQDVQITTDHVGHFCLTWQESKRIYGSLFSTKSLRWSTLTRLTPVDRMSKNYSVCFSAGGKGIMAWEDEASRQVMASELIVE
ncbi:MAG: hypothetical protein JSR58_00490 [Verrucomicrobia bacterium]|nr:hypothetical protein [Verrucomicrobiota bacterium]